MLLPNKNWLRPCGSMLFVSIANLRARRSYLLALSHFFVVDASSSTPQTKPIFRMKIITRLSPCVFCRCVILCSRTNYRPKRKSRLPCFFFVHVSSSAPCTNFRYMLACFFLFLDASSSSSSCVPERNLTPLCCQCIILRAPNEISP